jgi:hypothetical protein
MVTYYNKTDLTSFGEYLLSEHRKANIRGDLSKVHHADFENWLEEQRTKRRAKVLEPQAEAPQPQATVPQWLIDHLAEAPEGLRAYVLKVFPERHVWKGGEDLSRSFGFSDTLEGGTFWARVYIKSWSDALEELAKQQRG